MSLDDPVNFPPIPPAPDVAQERQRLLARFTYQAPTPDQVPLYEALRPQARDLAAWIFDNVPSSPERDQAIDLIDMAVMRANAAIARNPVGNQVTPPPIPQPQQGAQPT